MRTNVARTARFNTSRTVTDADGLVGRLEDAPQSKSGQPEVQITLPEGLQIVLPEALLQHREQNQYYLPMSIRALIEAADQPEGGEVDFPQQDSQVNRVSQVSQTRQTRQPRQSRASRQSAASDEDLIVPVIAEELVVEKKQIDTAKVRIVKRVNEENEVVDEPLTRDTVDIQRVSIGRYVDEPLPMRQEGETLIVPILEEVLVVEKRLMLKEELHITRRSTVSRMQQSVTLRKEEARVERIDLQSGAA